MYYFEIYNIISISLKKTLKKILPSCNYKRIYYFKPELYI